MELTLVSHKLCPYVQRAFIVLSEKNASFNRTYIDLANKPDWFKAVSPLGKTPVLLVDDEPVFESAVICEYLEDTLVPRLHPADALRRAQHRGWVEYSSAVLNTIWGYYTARDEPALEAKRTELIAQLARVEQVLDAKGPWFAGMAFSVVDAAFAPVFRYFDAFEAIGEVGWFDATPRLRAWRHALSKRASVVQAVSPGYPQLLLEFLRTRGSELSKKMVAETL